MVVTGVRGRMRLDVDLLVPETFAVRCEMIQLDASLACVHHQLEKREAKLAAIVATLPIRVPIRTWSIRRGIDS